jgi:serine/threonine-protein kinase
MSSQLADSIDDDRIGTQIGAYEIEALIGRGGMGLVYAARDGNRSRVALKIIKDEFASDENARARFNREAKIAKTIDNPHVVPVIDSGEHEGLPYIVERFIEGGSLADKLQRDGRLDVRTTIDICTQVAYGLQALWATGIVHRDLKPGNILLDKDGKAYITDFGLAKLSGDGVLTQPGQSVGSLDYMPPEQIRGEEVTGAADIYALGCVIFECLLGRPPFANGNTMRVLWAHLQDEPPDPSVDRGDVTPELGEALKWALRKQADERPSSSVEYANSLSLAAGIQR